MELSEAVESAVLSGKLSFDNIVEGLIEESAKLYTLVQNEESGEDEHYSVTPRELFEKRFHVLAEKVDNLKYRFEGSYLKLWFEEWRAEEGIQFYDAGHFAIFSEIACKIQSQVKTAESFFVEDWLVVNINYMLYMVNETLYDNAGWGFYNPITSAYHEFI